MVVGNKRKRFEITQYTGKNKESKYESMPEGYSGIGPMKKGNKRYAITKYSSTLFKKGEEIKTVDVLFTGAYAANYTVDTAPLQKLNLNTNTCVQAVNLVQQGAGISQRIGNKISLKSLRLRLSLFTTANVNIQPTDGRVLVIYDRQPNAGYININNILSSSKQDNTIVNGTCYDSLNPNYFDRFVILYDEFISMPPNDTAGNNSTVGSTEICSFHIDKYIDLQNLESQFNGTANPLLIANVNIGALLVCTYGNQAAGNDPWCLTGAARLRFRDN